MDDVLRLQMSRMVDIVMAHGVPYSDDLWEWMCRLLEIQPGDEKDVSVEDFPGRRELLPDLIRAMRRGQC
jgi:hypothetical protein